MFCRTGASTKTSLHKFVYLCRWPSYIRKVKWRKLSWHKLGANIIKQKTITEFSCANILIHFCFGGRQEAVRTALKRTFELEVEKSRISTVSGSKRRVTVLRCFFYQFRGADKSLARPGRQQAKATEDFDVHISYL